MELSKYSLELLVKFLGEVESSASILSNFLTDKREPKIMEDNLSFLKFIVDSMNSKIRSGQSNMKLALQSSWDEVKSLLPPTLPLRGSGPVSGEYPYMKFGPKPGSVPLRDNISLNAGWPGSVANPLDGKVVKPFISIEPLPPKEMPPFNKAYLYSRQPGGIPKGGEGGLVPNSLQDEMMRLKKLNQKVQTGLAKEEREEVSNVPKISVFLEMWFKLVTWFFYWIWLLLISLIFLVVVWPRNYGAVSPFEDDLLFNRYEQGGSTPLLGVLFMMLLIILIWLFYYNVWIPQQESYNSAVEELQRQSRLIDALKDRIRVSSDTIEELEQIQRSLEHDLIESHALLQREGALLERIQEEQQVLSESLSLASAQHILDENLLAQAQETIRILSFFSRFCGS